MKAPKKTPKTYRLSQTCIEQLAILKGEDYTETEIIEMAVNAYYQGKKTPFQRFQDLFQRAQG